MNVAFPQSARPESHGERFLYLYLSLMISIFCIITLISLRSATNDKSLSYEAVGAPSEGAHTLFGAQQTLLGREDLDLFTENENGSDFQVSPAAFQSIEFLLNAHNVWGIVRIAGDEEFPEGAFARALALQSHLERSHFTAHDLRIEIVFGNDASADVELLLFPLDSRTQINDIGED